MTSELLTDLIQRGGITGQRKVNSPIALSEFPVSVRHGGREFDAVAIPHMEFVPHERLWFELMCGEAERLRATFRADHSPLEGELLIKETRETLTVNWMSGGKCSEGIAVSPRQIPMTLTPRVEQIAVGAFDLFNFPEIGPRGRYRENGVVIGGCEEWRRLILEAGGWRISIAPLLDADGRLDSLEENGGFVVSHTGIIERTTGEEFSSDELIECGQVVKNFLSLALGRWCGPCFLAGFSSLGVKRFEQWGVPWADAGHWRPGFTWFDCDHKEILTQVFPGFMALIGEAHWNRTISESIYLYVKANSGGFGTGIDVGLIVAQSALERLAWTYFVACGRTSETKFKQDFKDAWMKIGALLKELDIPDEIPADFASLGGGLKPRWECLSRAVTAVRNEFVHPKPKIQRHPDDAKEAWFGALWLLDLIFLKLCGHSGKYMRRFGRRSPGMVRPMPTRSTGP